MKQREKVLAKIKSLPAMAATASKMTKLLEDPNVNIHELVDTIKYDPGLTANVLKLANSAYFGFARSVSSIRHAITLLGMKQVHRLVVAASFSSLMSKSVVGYELPEGELWRHSVASAIAAEKLCEMVKVTVKDTSFTAGLLHDIGKLILSSFVEKDFSEIEKTALVEEESFEKAEKEILGIDHAEVGGAILEQWRFPKELVDAVRWHHHPEVCKGESRMVVDIVHVADALCLTEGIGVGREGLQYRPSEEALKRLNLRTLMLEAIISQTMTGMEELKDLLEMGK